MMKSTTEFRKENKDFLEKLKNADIVICMDKSKVKDYFIDNNICNYLQKCYYCDIDNIVNEYNISAYLISYGFKSNRVDIYDSYYNSIYAGSYEDIKNCINNKSNTEYFKLPSIIDALDTTIYVDKNKYKIAIEYGCSIYEEGAKSNSSISNSYYYIKIYDKINEYLYFCLNLNINDMVKLIKTLNCDEENKNKYYYELVEAMNHNNLFQECISVVKDFEDKMLLLEIYKSIFNK